MSPKILCITGLSNSGKTKLCNYIMKKGYPKFSLGDYIRKKLKSKNMKLSYSNMRKISLKYAPKKDTTLVGEFIEEINSSEINEEFIVLEGIKKRTEIIKLAEIFEIYSIAILASSQTRYMRLKNRNRQDDSLFKHFLKRDEDEICFGICEVIALADHFIVNEGGINEAYKSVDEFLLKIQKKPLLKITTFEDFLN